jgi:AMP phosphorylase
MVKKMVEEYSQDLKVRLFEIEAGKLIIVLNEIDAREFGITTGDRVELLNKKNKKSTVAIVDTTKSAVKENHIGIFDDVAKKLGLKGKEQISVAPTGRLISVDYIRKKLKGEKLKEEEINEIVKDISQDRLSDVEAIAFTSAVYINGFDLNETVYMTKALIKNGRRIDFGVDHVVDKHSIGGVNGRATMLIVPIVASMGLYMPKTSSRSITSAAGTADAMEVLAPVTLSFNKIKSITKKQGGVIAWGGSVDLAPADDKIIKLRHPLSIDPEGQVIASVLAKKASAGSKHVVIDFPVGKYVKVKNKKEAMDLSKKFVYVGKKLGLDVEVVLTNGDDPSGLAFGPALEAKYALEILEGKRFDNLAEKACELAGSIFELAGKFKEGQGYRKAKEILVSGMALSKMKEIIIAQGGKITKSTQIIKSPINYEVKAKESGVISELDIRYLTKIARLSGAPANMKAGVELSRNVGEEIEKGEVLYTIYAENQRRLEIAKKFAKKVTVEKMV